MVLCNLIVWLISVAMGVFCIVLGYSWLYCKYCGRELKKWKKSVMLMVWIVMLFCCWWCWWCIFHLISMIMIMVRNIKRADICGYWFCVVSLLNFLFGGLFFCSSILISLLLFTFTFQCLFYDLFLVLKIWAEVLFLIISGFTHS